MRLSSFMYPRKSVAFWSNYPRKSVVNAGFYPRKSVFLKEIPHFKVNTTLVGEKSIAMIQTKHCDG